MRRASHRPLFGRPARLAGVAFTLAAVLAGTTGLSCDENARAAFRDEATSAIGTGVKTILDAIIDGAVAAIEQAGDGSTTNTTTGTSTGTTGQ